MTVYRIRFVGPATHAMRVVTALADADGVDLISSDPPTVRDEDNVELDVSAEAEQAAIADAIADIRDVLPRGATIDLVDD